MTTEPLSLAETSRTRMAATHGASSRGFRAATKLDDSPATLRQTKLAVARAKEGDREALQFLYVRYSNNVYGYVCSILRNEHDAEDVTQHVFAKLTTAITKYDERGIPFSGWLLRLARNVAIDHQRANRVTPVEEVLDPNAAAGANLEGPLVFREALDTLPEEQRQVFLLRHVVGLSPGEIADRMGRSEASIHGLHHRGRRALRTHLTGIGSKPSTMRRLAPPKAQATAA